MEVESFERSWAVKILLTAIVLGAGASLVQADVSKDDLKALAKLGMSEEFLEKYLKANAPVGAYSAEDIADLGRAGVGPKILGLLAKGVPRENDLLSQPSPAATRERPPFLFPVPGLPFLPPFYSMVVPLCTPPGRAPAALPGPLMRDPALDPLGGFAFPAYGFSYYPRMQYYAPSYSYLSPTYGFSYRSGH